MEENKVAKFKSKAFKLHASTAILIRQDALKKANMHGEIVPGTIVEVTVQKAKVEDEQSD